MDTDRLPTRRTAVSLIGLAALAVLGAGCSGDSGGHGGSSAAEPDLATLKNFQPVPGRPLGPATGPLRLTDGTPWSFTQARKGAVTIVYFGYTRCPDVCPLTMADLSRALVALPASVRSRIDVRFVSTDPKRDTDTQLTTWLRPFGASFVGARGPIRDVIADARSYGVAIVAPKVTKGDYQVAHGAELLVLSPGGGMVGYFRRLAGWRDYAAALPKLIETYA